MANRLASAILLALGTSTLFAACDDGDDRVDEVLGGEAGEAGKKTGGSGGTSGGKGGTQAGGGEMQGGDGPGTAGHAGMTGGGGDPSVGGAPMGGTGGTDGGAVGMGGEGGAEGPTIVHACGNQTISRRLCSAFIAAECEDLPACVGDPVPDPCCDYCPAYTCPDCVEVFDSDRETFTECPACLAEYDRNLLCAIEPFEAGNLSEGVACWEGGGAERHEDCEPILLSVFRCLDYKAVNDVCPETWPLEGTGGAGGSDGL